MVKKQIMNVNGLNIVQHLALFAMATLISGCAGSVFGGYGANGQSREDFEHHVEEVFRLQNRMTSKVMMILDSGDAIKPETLLQAEQHMQLLCEDLNEYVSRDLDGLSSGIFLRRRVEKSAIDCENAALALERLLKP